MKPVTNSNAPVVIRQCAKAILAIPINEPEHRAKCAASLQQSSKLFRGWRAVRPPPDGSPNMNVRLRPVQSLVSEALKVRAVLYCLSSSGSSRHSTAIRIIDKILAAIEREN